VHSQRTIGSSWASIGTSIAPAAPRSRRIEPERLVDGAELGTRAPCPRWCLAHRNASARTAIGGLTSAS
jgi:hypothetical protein